MSGNARRRFLTLAGLVVGAASAGAFAASDKTRAQSGAKKNVATGTRIVVIGGGFAGATCARYLKRADPGLSVTLIEPNERIATCPFSNQVVAGLRELDSITQDFFTLKRLGIDIVHDTVNLIDPVKRRIKLSSHVSLNYDRLVLAPGIEFKWDAIGGYDEKTAATMPHAWKAGAQTLRLRQQLQAMPDGGTFIIVAPANPFRCPPGPYERASLVAHYFKRYKPRSKILILDAKDAFSKQELFMQGWGKLYPGMIEWIPSAKGGTVTAVNAKTLTVESELDRHQGTVVNLIPPQTAGKIALQAGLTDDSGWCPVNPATWMSTKHKNIHVVGDAAIAGALPKSGSAANSEAKMAAAAIVAELHGQPPPEASYINACYSLLAPDYAISVTGAYRPTANGISEVPGSAGTSPKDVGAEYRALEAKYALGWYDSITKDTWQ